MCCFGWFGWSITHHFTHCFMHIEKRGNSLLIKFSHDSKPYSFSLPKHNNPVGMSAAKMKMAQIEKDIAYGNFHTTLLRYKPRKLGNNPTAIMAVELFEKYIPYHQQERGLSHGSGLKLEAIASKLNVCRIRTTSKREHVNFVRTK